MLIALKIQSVILIIFSSCISSAAPKCLIRLLACYPCFLYVFGITKNTSNYRSDLFKVIPLILPLEENFIQPEHYPNQSDNQQSNEYWDNQIRHASSAC